MLYPQLESVRPGAQVPFVLGGTYGEVAVRVFID